MAKRKKIKIFSFQGFDNAHYKTTAAYTRAVNALLNKATEDVANMAVSLDVDTEKPFSFNDYPKAKARLQTTLKGLAKKMQAVIELGSRKQWLFACQKNDEFIASIFDTTKLTKGRLKKMQDRNLDALQTFQQRKVGGMNLSERVWKYTEQYKEQIEIGLDVGLGDGRSAQQLSRDLRQNLQDPNRLFRRVRDKRGNLQLSKVAKAFHPGIGVYRSSYKNAVRLTRSEINMAYRESDWLRWQNLDFVIGFEVRRSNHEPLCECKLCARLVGQYPKWFKFKGWHPQCMCYCVPILDDFYSKERSDDRVARLRAALRGEKAKKYVSKGLIKDLPDGFKEWVRENASKQAGWATTPYFIRDNFIDGDLSKGLIYIQNAKPLTLLERVAIRHQQRTQEQVQDIQKRWEERKQKHALIKQEAQGILDKAKDYNEVDFSALQNAIDSGDIGKMQSIAKEVEKGIAEIQEKQNNSKNIFHEEVYSQDRKNDAIWCKSMEESKNTLNQVAENVYKTTTLQERFAVKGYTSESDSINRPLRGYDSSWDNFKGVGNVPLDNENPKTPKRIKLIEDVISRSSYQTDIWVQRGVSESGLCGFLGIKNTSELSSCIGKIVTDPAFLSCGAAKGTGFTTGYILNIYCPRGTKMLYIDGRSLYPQENEMLLQRNTSFRVTKIDGYFIDIEVVSQ